jgi:hypothetical protein
MSASVLPEKPNETFVDPFQHLPENAMSNAQISEDSILKLISCNRDGLLYSQCLLKQSKGMVKK